MNQKEIIKYLKDKIEPINDSAYGIGYPASVYLTDGLFLPCVIFYSSAPRVKLAMKRFKEEKSGLGIFKSAAGYFQIVKTFVAGGNILNDYDISKIETSKNAFPKSILKQVQGETTMGWTGFVAKMKDGKNFAFGTRFNFIFFDFPQGYSAEDIVEIINHSYIAANGEVKSHRTPFAEWPNDDDKTIIFREKPYFECYLDNL